MTPIEREQVNNAIAREVALELEIKALPAKAKTASDEELFKLFDSLREKVVSNRKALEELLATNGES